MNRSKPTELTPERLTEFFYAIEDRVSLTKQDKRAILLIALTASHLSTCLNIEWSDLDLEKGTWTIPAHKSKNSALLVVPLTDLMLKIILLQKTDQLDSKFVFPHPTDPSAPADPSKLSILIKRIGLDGTNTLYDFRRLFKSVLTSADTWNDESILNVLGHISLNEVFIKMMKLLSVREKRFWTGIMNILINFPFLLIFHNETNSKTA